MTALQMSILAGILIAIGPVILLFTYAPRYPALGAYLDAVNRAPAAGGEVVRSSLEDRIGWWLQQHAGRWLNTPREELEILRIPVHKHLTQRLLFALIGLALPALLAALLWLVGIPMPIIIPAGASLLTAVLLSFIPNLEARAKAETAREEFRYVLSSYMDLVALERLSAAAPSPRQALTQAAQVADHWVFRRLAEEMAHSRLSGVPVWDRLRQLGTTFQVNELVELGSIMRIAGSESASIYETLAQRSKAMRKAHLAKSLSQANEVSTTRSAPVAVLGAIFLALLVVPGLLALLGM